MPFVPDTLFINLFFETEIRHQYEAYRNFTEAGIRVGKGHQKATAETLYDNCLFEGNGTGVALWQDNVLDHTFRNSEFRKNGTGIYSGRGTNFYAQNCHFEQNTAFDIFSAGEAASSVRRCTSQKSNQFIGHYAYLAPITVQDCHVDGWTNPTGSVMAWGAGPTVIFDCVFTNPPNDSPPLAVAGDLRARRVITSNNRADGAKSLVAGAGHPFRDANVFDVPVEIVEGVVKSGGVVKSASQSFLQTKVAIPGKVFDAKRDFGAKGDFLTDDTKAVQKTIDAARAHGKGAIAYFPSGQYMVTETVNVTGSDYYVGGSGYQAVLGWKGAEGGTLMHVHDADRITIENISVSEEGNGFNPVNAIDILQTGSDKPSFITYDRVQSYGIYKNNPLVKGLHFKNLGKGDRVLLNEVEGNLRFIDSAQSTVFIPLSYEGSIVVEGKSTKRDGFLGGNARLATATDPGLWVKDNHSIVMSDFYTESGSHFIRLEGDNTLPAGRVTMQGAKFELGKPENNAVEVTNYKGELFIGPYEYYVGNPLHKFVQTGEAPFDLTIWGSLFYESDPDFKLAPTANLAVVGNSRNNDAAETRIVDVAARESLPKLRRALDDLRRLGKTDLEMTTAVK